MTIKSKLKAIDPKAASPSRPKVLIFGKPGVKKTWVSLDFPTPYYIDTEGGANLAAYTDKLKKAGGVYFGPEQGSQDFEEIIEQVKALATEKHHFKTLVIDSKSKIFNIEIAKEMERLGDKDQYGASKKAPVAKTRRLINWLDRLDMTVILICHEKPLWAQDKQIGVTFDGYDKLEYELHLCLNIAKQGASSRAFIKKSRLPGFEDGASFEWTYEEFAERFGKEAMEAEAQTIVFATESQLKEFKYLTNIINIPEGQDEKWLKAGGCEKFEEMETSKLQAIIDVLKSKITTKPEEK